MAKNNDDDEDYTLDLDGLDDLDRDDFDIDGISAGAADDRSPMSQAVNAGSKALFDSTLGNPAVRDELITDSLPTPFRSAYRKTESIKGEIDKTLDHLEKEVRESKRDAKAAARAVLPMLKPFLPASVTRKVADLSKEEQGWNGSEMDRDSAEIAAALDNIFGAKDPQVARKEQQDEQLREASEMVNEEKKNIKQDSLLAHVINIDDGVRSVVRAHASAVNYRRNMLELNYRQYFAQRDLLKANVEAYEKIIPSLEAITKNTALPDYAKEEFGEITGALMKRNIIEKLSPLNWSRNYHKYVGIAARNKITELASNARNAFTMMQMGGAMGGGYNEEERDITEAELRQNYMNQGATVAGSMGGDLITEKLLRPATGKLRKWLQSNPEAMKLFATGSMAIDNQAAFLNSIRGDPNANFLLRKLTQGIDWLGVRGPDDMNHVDFETETVASLSKAANLTRKSIRTLEHVLPGALFKIDQSIRRIYDPKAALEMFDYERDKFVTVESWKKHVYATAHSDINSRSLNTSVNSLFTDIGYDNVNSKAELAKINDVSIDIIKKSFEVAARNHCNIFDPRQLGGEERVPLGMDISLWYGMDSDEERDKLVVALKGVIDAGTFGLSGDALISRVYAIKLQINQRAQQHYGASNGQVANRVRDVLGIYGYGVVTQTDLVEGKRLKSNTRPDYYLGKTKVINGEWVGKGAYYTAQGVLFNLREVQSTIFGPNPEGKPDGPTSALVTVQQLQFLRTQTGEHYLAVENSLDFGDKNTYRVNHQLGGTSALVDDWKGTLGSQFMNASEESEYTRDGEIEESLRTTSEEHRTKRGKRINARRIESETESIRNSAQIKIDRMSINVDGVEKRLDNILAQMIHSGNTVREDIREIILAIETNSGIVSHSIHLDPKIREKLEAARAKARSWGQRIAEKGRNTRDWTKNKFKSANEWLSKYDLSMNPFKLVGRLSASTFHAVTEFGKGILGRRDILDALGNVVISAIDIQSKRLFTLDENNEYKLITKIQDIKGGVYRLAEDGVTYNQVFSPDEIAAKFSELCYSTKTGMRKLASDVGGWAGERLRSLHERGKKIVNATRTFGLGAVKSAWGAVAYIPDVYYSLDPEPREARLLARVAREDGYIDVKTGKPVRYFSDIHGEVRDLDGNVRISQADFENPTGKFIDADGEDVTSLFTSITGTLRRMRQRTWKAAKGVYDSFRKAAEFTKELSAKMLGSLAGLFNKGGIVFGQRLVVQRLEQIYILLNDRLKGSGRGGPLPFTPMTDDGHIEKTVSAAASKTTAAAKAKVKDILDRPMSEYLDEYKGKAQATYNRVKSSASKRLTNYTDKFSKEFTRMTGIDPNVHYSKLMERLGETRDNILAESGIDQSLLDIALLDKEFENLYRRYQRGEMTKTDYQERVKELALSSEYAKIYEKSMGFLGKKLRKLREEAAERVRSQATKTAGEVKSSKYWNSTEKARMQMKEIFNTAVSKLSPKSIKAQVEAITKEINSLDPADPNWEDKIIALHERKAALLEKVAQAGSSTGNYFGRGVNFLKTKFTGRGGDIRFTREGKLDSDGDGERDGSFASKLKKRSQMGFFKNMADAFGATFGAAKNAGKSDGKPGILSAISRLFAPMMTVLTPLIGGLLTNVFTGAGGVMSMLKVLVQSIVSGGGGLLMTGTRMLGGAAMSVGAAGLSMAGGALGAMGGAALGVALNPMTWIAVGTAAAIYGTYKTYKWATADRLPKIDQLRVATYGAEDYSRLDLSDTQKTLFLEDAIRPYVSYSSDGTAKIGNISGKDMVRILQGWGIEPTDQQSVQLFMNWFQRRFLPVHYIWLTAAKQHLNIESLKDIGNEKSFKAADRLKLAKATRLKSSSHIWKMAVGPYNDSDLLGFKDVDELFEDVIKDWEAEAEKSPQNDKDTYLGGSRRYEVKQLGKKDEKKEYTPEFELKDRRSIFSFNDKAGNSEELDGREVYTSKVYSTVGYMPKDNGFRQVTNTVDALTAVRLRLYGCWDLTTQNVNNAFALEDMVYPDLDASKDKIEYKGDFAKLFEDFRGLGGLPSGYQLPSFKRWFDNMFFPVLTAYIGAVNKELKSDSPFNIPRNGGSKGFTIARAMYAVRGDSMMNPLPFINEEIDTRSLATDTLEASMATLEKVQRAYKIKEKGEKSKTADKPAETEAQRRVREASSGRYELRDGKIVSTGKGPNTIAPWKPGNQANGGGRPPASVWGNQTSEQDAMAGYEGPIKPPPPSPKREEAERLIIQMAIKAGITDKTEIAMLLAQAAHESNNFSAVEENLNYSSSRLLEIFPRYFSAADAQKYGRNPVAIGNIAYGKRMGNKDPGDGYKYRGRGFMQLTGRYNYEALAKAFPKAKDPDWVSTPEGAAASAVYWWTNIASNSIRRAAKGGDVLSTTKVVNGGTNGIADRRNKFSYYMDQIKSGNIKIEGTKEEQSADKTEESGLAGAQRESGGTDNEIDVMSQGAGVNSTPVKQPLTESAKSNAAIQEREAGRPEDVATKSMTTAVKKAQPPAPKPAPPTPRAAKASAPSQEVLKKEGEAMREHATEHALAAPVDKLVDIAGKQLATLNAILEAVSGGRGTPGTAPVSMRS